MSNVWPNGGLTVPPAPGQASSGFRASSEYDMARKNPVTGIVQPHYGIDLVGFDAIISPVTGVVTFAGYNGGAGNEVRIKEDGTGDVIRLLHNRALNVRSGQRVNQGNTVAWMGSTGQSTGPHSHEETRPGGGNAINPRDWYARRNGGSPAGGGGTPINQHVQEDSMIRIQATNRGIALIGPGYYRGLKNDEEVQNSGPLITPPGGVPWHYTGNDRQFDLWASMALSGRTPDTDQLNATRGDAQNAANIASEVRNWITDPNHGLVKLITNVGQVDSAMIAKAIQDALKDVEVDAEVTDETIAKIADAAIDKLIERAKD